jgi:hypothetical protein
MGHLERDSLLELNPIGVMPCVFEGPDDFVLRAGFIE